jgi:hypothetical protein
MTKNSMKVIGRNGSQDRLGSEERRGGIYDS